MAHQEDLAGTVNKFPAESGYFHQPLQRYKLNVAFGDLGSGASDAIACAAFPENVIVVARALEIVTAFAGEADLAVSGGDTGDADGQFAAITIHALAAGWVDIVPGAESGARFEGDYATAGADLTFTATELDNVTAGELNYYIYYYSPMLSTDS